MEVAASVAGLISLAGQCFEAAERLRNLYVDIRAASRTVDIFIKDVNGLIRALHDVRTLLEHIEESSVIGFHSLHLTTLKIHLDDCNHEMAVWLDTARRYRPPAGHGSKKWFKKFWVALNKESVKNVSTDLRSRRSDIMLALSVLGRTFDAEMAVKTTQIGSGVETSNILTKEVLEVVARTQESVDRIETLSEMSVGSMRSLRSAVSYSPRSSRHQSRAASPARRPSDFDAPSNISGAMLEERLARLRQTLETDTKSSPHSPGRVGVNPDSNARWRSCEQRPASLMRAASSPKLTSRSSAERLKRTPEKGSVAGSGHEGYGRFSGRATHIGSARFHLRGTQSTSNIQEKFSSSHNTVGSTNDKYLNEFFAESSRLRIRNGSTSAVVHRDVDEHTLIGAERVGAKNFSHRDGSQESLIRTISPSVAKPRTPRHDAPTAPVAAVSGWSLFPKLQIPDVGRKMNDKRLGKIFEQASLRDMKSYPPKNEEDSNVASPKESKLTYAGRPLPTPPPLPDRDNRREKNANLSGSSRKESLSRIRKQIGRGSLSSTSDLKEAFNRDLPSPQPVAQTASPAVPMLGRVTSSTFSNSYQHAFRNHPDTPHNSRPNPTSIRMHPTKADKPTSRQSLRSNSNKSQRKEPVVRTSHTRVDSAITGFSENDHARIDLLGFNPHSIVMSSWDLHLLGHWTDPRDRINRWMLHALAFNEAQTSSVHRRILEETMDVSSIENFEQCWGRLVLKYWFLDEAAIGSGPVNVQPIEYNSSVQGPSSASRKLKQLQHRDDENSLSISSRG